VTVEHIPAEESVEERFQNPVSQVMFRAGLLAARESLARFVEQGGDANTAASIRANWWPALCPDPGRPRRHNWDEVADGGEEGPWTAKSLTAEQEALPQALIFLLSVCGHKLEEYES
jgi:hypothetical protein